MIDVYNDLCLAVEFLNRAAVLRDELGEHAYRRAMRTALVAIGDVAIEEAEHLIAAIPDNRIGTVIPFAPRARPEAGRGGAADPEPSKRRIGHRRRDRAAYRQGTIPGAGMGWSWPIATSAAAIVAVMEGRPPHHSPGIPIIVGRTGASRSTSPSRQQA